MFNYIRKRLTKAEDFKDIIEQITIPVNLF